MIRSLSAGVMTIACSLAASAAFAETQTFPLTSLEGTENHEVITTPVRYKGFEALHVTVSPEHKSIEQGGCDNCTFTSLDGIDFSNGSIEIEVAGKPVENAPNWARGFVGILFRADVAAGKYEGVYLRPRNATAKTQIQRNHTLQYFSIPGHPWHALRKETPGHYESYAPLETGAWTKMRVDVDGTTMRLFLNGSSTPALTVNDLKLGADQRGTIALFTEPATDAYFRNLVVTPREAGFSQESEPRLSEADAGALIKPFYDLFSLKGKEEDARAAFADTWKSYYSNEGFRTLDETLEFVVNTWPKMLPNSKWVQDDLSVTTDNEIVVRGTLTGTPAGETFFGAPVTGKSISIMTLDTHKVVNGKIVETHHVEDWARGLRQLAK